MVIRTTLFRVFIFNLTSFFTLQTPKLGIRIKRLLTSADDWRKVNFVGDIYISLHWMADMFCFRCACTYRPYGIVIISTASVKTLFDILFIVNVNPRQMSEIKCLEATLCVLLEK